MDKIERKFRISIRAVCFTLDHCRLRAYDDFAKAMIAGIQIIVICKVDGKGNAVCWRGVVKICFMQSANFRFFNETDRDFIGIYV